MLRGKSLPLGSPPSVAPRYSMLHKDGTHATPHTCAADRFHVIYLSRYVSRLFFACESREVADAGDTCEAGRAGRRSGGLVGRGGDGLGWVGGGVCACLLYVYLCVQADERGTPVEAESERNSIVCTCMYVHVCVYVRISTYTYIHEVRLPVSTRRGRIR